MARNFIILIIVLCSSALRAQVNIREIRLNATFGERDEEFNRTVAIKEVSKKDSADFVYPIIVAGNKEVSDRINRSIQQMFFETDTLTIMRALTEEIKQRLVYLNYDVALNTSELLSLRITAEGCGNYCSSYDTYFNFDVKTGKVLAISDVITDTAAFGKVVFADKVKALETYKKEQDSLFRLKEISAEDFEFCIEYASECMGQVSLDKFILTKDDIQIFDECNFIHAMRGMQPVYTLIYSYRTFPKYIRLQKLIK